MMANISWDPKNISIKTYSIEKTLQPLVEQITTMVSGKRKKKKNAPAKKAPQIAKEIEASTKRLVEVGENIANEFPVIKEPMLEACKEARSAGDNMRNASNTFAADPCDSNKRSVMVKAARTLLLSVTRLLCIADMADVHRLLVSLNLVETRLKDLVEVESKTDLLNSFKKYGDELMTLAKLTGARQADLKSVRQKEEIASARAMLKKSSRMLLTSTKTYITHSDVTSAQNNRDYVVKQISEAVATISGVAQASDDSSEKQSFEEVGFIGNALEEFLAQLDRDDVLSQKAQDEMQNLWEDISEGATALADSSGTRNATKNKIYGECENVKVALASLIEDFVDEPEKNLEELEAAKDFLEQKTKDLSKQLRRSVADHVSDSFMEANTPLLKMIDAAEDGNEKIFRECVVEFEEHALKLQEVCKLACNMSTNADGVKMVKLASKQAKALCPQVIYAATTLCARTGSEVAAENMAVFRDAWLNHVKLLTEAVDDITTIDDFLSVSELHIFEDINQCVEAMRERNAKLLEELSNDVQARVDRVDHVVTSEMSNYESGPFTQGVKRAVLVMRNNVIAQFIEHVEMIIEAVNNNKTIDENSFIDAARLVCEGVKDIKRAVMMRRPLSQSDLESDEEYDNQPSLLTKMSDEQAQQRERLAYEQLKAGGKVQFEVHSEAADDKGWRGKSSIIVNGIEYCPRKRGHNVVVLNEVGSVVNVRAFDTVNNSGGLALANFLDAVPTDHVALIAVHDTSGDGIHSARKALERLGAKEPIDPGYRSSWAFAGFSGDHDFKNWVSQVSRPRYQGPAMISDMINTPAADMGKILIDISAQGCEDQEYTKHSSIKVNDIERSVMGRGMNVVILDGAGNFLMSKNFDTADPQHALSEGKRLARFLSDLPSDRIVCMASLEDVGIGFKEAENEVHAIGIDDFVAPGRNGAVALVGSTGPQEALWAQFVSCSRGKGPATINEFVITPAAEAEVTSGETTDVFSDYEFTRTEDFEKEKYYLSEREDYASPTRQSARSKMRALPAEDKAKINKLAEGLTMEKNRLFTEVNKWHDQGNDIIVLAKKMCMIMMDMSDFARGNGPLKTTMDVVRAAEKIAKYGARMNKLAGEIAEMEEEKALFGRSRKRSRIILLNYGRNRTETEVEKTGFFTPLIFYSVFMVYVTFCSFLYNLRYCILFQCPHSHARSDLLAYLQRIALYSHQIIITAKVKTDFQEINGEIIASEVENAMSLIQSAKNLMNAVIATVKASYIASTKHKTGGDVVSWKMKVPEKKLLYRPEQFNKN